MRGIALILAGAFLWRWADTFLESHPAQIKVAACAAGLFALGIFFAALGE